MKKVLVSCDEYAYSLNGQYFLRDFGVVLLKRYLEVFDAVRFAVRTKKVNSKIELQEHKIKLIDKRIEIFEFPFFQGPKEYACNYFKIKNRLTFVANNCDLAIIRIPSTIGFACLSVVKRKKIPYAVEVVANPYEFRNNSVGIISHVLYTFIHKQQKKACKNADGISYVTQHSLQKIYPALKKGIIESNYSSIELPDSFFQIKRESTLNKSSFVICHVSLHIKTYTKGHITVINVVKHLTEKGLQVSAKFAGEGNLIDVFKKYARELGVSGKIEFVGLLNQQGLKELYFNSDFMLFPSSSEGLPRAIIEAQATGLPCLATPVGGIPELIESEFLFNQNDVRGFTNKIVELIKSPDYYNDVSRLSVEKAKNFSKDVLQQRRIEFYTKLKSL